MRKCCGKMAPRSLFSGKTNCIFWDVRWPLRAWKKLAISWTHNVTIHVSLRNTRYKAHQLINVFYYQVTSLLHYLCFVTLSHCFQVCLFVCLVIEVLCSFFFFFFYDRSFVLGTQMYFCRRIRINLQKVLPWVKIK